MPSNIIILPALTLGIYDLSFSMRVEVHQCIFEVPVGNALRGCMGNETPKVSEKFA